MELTLNETFPLTEEAKTPTQRECASEQRLLDLRNLVLMLGHRIDTDLAGDRYGTRPYTDGARHELRYTKLFIEQLITEATS